MYDLYNIEAYSLYSHPGGSEVRIRLPMQEMQVWSLGQEDPLEKEMATHSNILAWEFPWTEEPGGLQSIGLQKSQTQLSGYTTIFLLYSLCWQFFIMNGGGILWKTFSASVEMIWLLFFNLLM